MLSILRKNDLGLVVKLEMKEKALQSIPQHRNARIMRDTINIAYQQIG